jgi:hypothetical protein
MKFILLILLFVSINLFSQEEIEYPITYVEGYTVHVQTGDTLRMMRIKLFVNDTLREVGMSDFDGYFKLQTHRVLDDSDQVDLQFFYPRDYMEEVSLTNPEFQNLLIQLNTDKTLTGREIHNFGGSFLAQLPNYLDCHPSPPIDPFEVK